MNEEILIKDKIIKKYGIAIRLIKFKPEHKNKKDVYIVEHTPLFKDNTYSKDYKNDWFIFGGSVGFTSSEWYNYKEAKEFFDDITNLTSKQMLEKYNNLWVE